MNFKNLICHYCNTSLNSEKSCSLKGNYHLGYDKCKCGKFEVRDVEDTAILFNSNENRHKIGYLFKINENNIISIYLTPEILYIKNIKFLEFENLLEFEKFCTRYLDNLIYE